MSTYNGLHCSVHSLSPSTPHLLECISTLVGLLGNQNIPLLTILKILSVLRIFCMLFLHSVYESLNRRNSFWWQWQSQWQQVAYTSPQSVSSKHYNRHIKFAKLQLLWRGYTYMRLLFVYLKRKMSYFTSDATIFWSSKRRMRASQADLSRFSFNSK